jgi:hypothetical protein
MATSHCFNGFWRLTRLSPTTTAESEHDVDVGVIALYRHWRGAELTRPASMGFAADWQRYFDHWIAHHPISNGKSASL